MKSRVLMIAFFVVLAATCLSAAEWHPKIAPVDKVQFNWPPPAAAGEADYFTIARDGKPACSIVLPANPTPYEEKSAAVLKTYLDIVTGGSFEIKREPAPGPAIYIGMTEVGKRDWTDLPKIQYPGLALPNLHGFAL